MFPIDCAKFRGSRATVGPAGLIPSCHRDLVGPDVGTIRKNTLGKKFWTHEIPLKEQWYDGSKPT